MVRRTKEEALATRDGILDAAEQLFVEQGVSRTTLQHIATAAGVTRGAIYWHFEDKAALFNAMMERAKMPLESAMQLLLETASVSDPLCGMREYMLCVFRLTAHDPKARRVFEIATLKLEYVDELNAVRDRRLEIQAQWMTLAEGRIKLGVRQGKLKPGLVAHAAALGMWALVDGLIRTWMFDTSAFDLVRLGEQIVDIHLDGLRAPPAMHG
ncbi:MAG: TetR family transcriptional regulator [Telluria sp.]